MPRTLSPTRHRTAALLVLALVLAGCADASSEPPLAPAHAAAVGAGPDLRAALRAQERHTPALMRIPGVVGTAVGLDPAGRPAVKVLVADRGVRGLPDRVDDVPVAVVVTGYFVARSDPTLRQRPAPLGFSLGHPEITAGTLGARVVSGGRVYVLSNNHVLANGNDAALGDAALQPGPYDGGTDPEDAIGELAAFAPLDFSGGDNTIDAALALTSTAMAGNATPADAYGAPASRIYGDADDDGRLDNGAAALLGVRVQKYGRTTQLTRGEVTGINATVTVCYESSWIFCTKTARFVDQIIVEPGSFSDGGDSGSLIVTDDAGRSPVGLLFAGSSSHTIANRIDLVLQYFGVRIDGASTDGGTEPPPPPPPVEIELRARGYKAKGLQKVDLSWSGTDRDGSSVTVIRNGAPVSLDSSLDDGAETDAVGQRGKGSYTYRLCDEGTCSNEVTVSF